MRVSWELSISTNLLPRSYGGIPLWWTPLETFCPLWQGVPNSGASSILLVSVTCITGPRNVFRVFLCCRLAGNGMQRLVLRVMVLKSLPTGAMMDNHAERLTNTWVSAKLGLLSILCVQLGPRRCLLHIVAGCPLFSSCLSIEVKWEGSWDFQKCSLYYGCPLLRGVY